jgi:hypothetical protein
MSLDYDHVWKLACALTFRHKNDPEIAPKLAATFGDNFLTMCGRDSSFGEDARHLLTVFWQNEIEQNPVMADVAGKLHHSRNNPRKGFGKAKGPKGKSVGMRRPGSLLAWMISQVTTDLPCPACNEHVKEMNSKGWLWCWTHRDKIIGWLIVAARDRGVEVTNGLELLKAAFTEARKLNPDKKIDGGI